MGKSDSIYKMRVDSKCLLDGWFASYFFQILKQAIHSKPDYMTLKSGQLLSRLYALKTHY